MQPDPGLLAELAGQQQHRHPAGVNIGDLTAGNPQPRDTCHPLRAQLFGQISGQAGFATFDRVGPNADASGGQPAGGGFMA